MQLDTFIPDYDITMKHSIRIKASTSNVYRAMKEVRFQDFSPVVNMLFALRAFPERLFKTDYPDIINNNFYTSDNPFFEQLFSRGFILLADNDEMELVFGFLVPGGLSTASLIIHPMCLDRVCSFRANIGKHMSEHLLWLQGY